MTKERVEGDGIRIVCRIFRGEKLYKRMKGTQKTSQHHRNRLQYSFKSTCLSPKASSLSPAQQRWPMQPRTAPPTKPLSPSTALATRMAAETAMSPLQLAVTTLRLATRQLYPRMSSALVQYASQMLQNTSIQLTPFQGAGAGPACGTCWKLTIETDSSGNSVSNSGNSIVVEVTNLCPADGNPLCAQNGLEGTNQYGANLNFDLCIDSGASSAMFGDDGTALGLGTAEEVSCGQWQGTVQGN